VLSGLIDDVKTGEAALQGLIEDMAEANDLLDVSGAGELEDAPDAQPDRADELREKWGTETGQVWQIGQHRLMCGDSTSADDIRTLMGEDTPSLMVTSPPYFNQRDYSHWETYEEYKSFARLIIERTTDALSKDAICVTNIGSEEQAHRWMPADWWNIWNDNGWMYQESIAWVKAAAVWSVPRSMHIENGRYFPALRWEICLVVKRGKHPTFDIEDRDEVREFQENMWTIPVVSGQEQIKTGHPAPYPHEIPYRFIKAYTQRGASVYDPFNGSGSTLIASQRSGRICYGMEIEPKYVAVTLERMSDMGPALQATS
jgi:DNA modification methylase